MEDIFCIKLFGFKKNSYYETVKIYFSFLKKHFGINVAVIFDRYPSDPAQRDTKSSERMQHLKITDIMVKGNLINQVEQINCLRNEINKNQLIAFLKREFKRCGI